jgi:UDP-N-acetylmuramyl tripeptide synthase
MNKPYIIGITGSAGKTTCSYILQQYFKYLDYSCDVITSNYIDINNKIIEKRNHLSAEELQYYLRQASSTDYLIIEINEDSLKNDSYAKINFDCKILVNFYKDFNLHRDSEEYMLLKTNFMNSQDCLKIINRSSDNYKNLNIENAIVFNTSNDNDAIVSLVQDSYKFKNSNCVVRVDDENFTLSLGYNSSLYKSIITIIATLYGMDI